MKRPGAASHLNLKAQTSEFLFVRRQAPGSSHQSDEIDGDNRVRAKDVAITSRLFEHFGSLLCSSGFWN
jgi:hypothetical protein